MREVDTSETSVVWPAWCYSGETTVNEDLPQRLAATAAALAAAATTLSPSSTALASLHLQHKQQQQQQQQQKDCPRRHRRRQEQERHHHERASSNQSRSSSASSASVSSSPHRPLSPVSRTGLPQRPGRSRGKRKSITRTTSTTTTPVSSKSRPEKCAITAALEAAGSVGQTARSPGGLSPATDVQLYDGRQWAERAAAALTLLNNNDGDGNGHGPHDSDGAGYHFGAIDSRILREHQATLHSLDKMLSERIYDRKKYLNSPTGGDRRGESGGGGGGGGSVGGSPTAASTFYEKYRNGGSDVSGRTDMESQLNLIKNGSSNSNSNNNGGINGLSSSAHHLSAIAASIISNSNGSNSNSGNNGLTGEANGASGNHVAVVCSSSSSSSSSNGSSSGGNLGNQIISNKATTTNNNNNNSSANNNNIGSGCINNSNSSSIKSERFSPPNNDVQSMASRSRSATPSSFSGTPPQTMHAGDGFPGGGLLPSPNSMSTVGRPEFQARNYSDFMRSLAAKYNNNNNTNDVSNMKSSFLEPKMRFTPQPKSFIEGSLSSKKSSPLTSTHVPNPSIMTSLFSGLPFQSAVFPPLIDMSSTQALVTLARAAKESDIHNILKADTGGGLKKPSSLSRGSSPPVSVPHPHPHHHHHLPSPFGTGYLPGLLPNHHLASFPVQPPPTTTSVALKSPSRAPETTHSGSTFPLDLSATTPIGSKRIKLSPTPSRNQGVTSPAPSSTNSQPSDSLDLKPIRKCHARIEEVGAWTVDNVCDFVASIDICAEYVQNFRDQSIDGAGLPLLTEEHLTNSLGMKLGPALKLRSMLAKKLGGPCPCTLCSVPTPPTRTNSSGSSSSKGDTTPTNRPPSNGSIG
ncbi:probable serine/threonine-protein kinase DDB_G0267686 [Anopheles aquasalis]|uniref:probable serine/threonine-protein kinase DDB_G0267686 n=1 Tax=Anopheles aquasalis TaxID=42839 RepID=UPI00215A47A4|nr:probable serine/threonine-protein kinase DDB_G0267686 [Anopheles aquasalis]XP_050082462.1 probable serine/threonine-protein kinase DDB_G0267686 [Anopheles aquasalis]